LIKAPEGKKLLKTGLKFTFLYKLKGFAMKRLLLTLFTLSLISLAWPAWAMTSLTNQSIAGSYGNLLQVNTSNAGLSSALSQVGDGLGDNVNLWLSTGNVAVNDATFLIRNTTDNTKLLQLSLSGVSTSTTITLTVPNQSGTVMDNTATGSNAIAVSNSSTTATASGNQAIALNQNAAATKFGQVAFASSKIASQGDNQHSIYIAYGNTTTTTASQQIFLDGSSAQITLATNQAIAFTARILGKTSAGESSTTVGCWVITGVIAKSSSNANTAIIGTNSTTTINTPSNWSAPTIVADTTNGAIKILVNPNSSSATTTQWQAVVDCNEVTY
jgi:hypothetical protein